MTATRLPLVSRWLIFILMSVLAASTLFPVLFMAITSLKSKADYAGNVFGLPSEWNFRNYTVIFDRFDVFRLGFNSLFVTVCAILLSLLITTMAAFAFAKLTFKGNKLLFALVIACMMVPGQVLIIPVYRLMADFGLVNHYSSLILFYASTSIPFATFLLTANCRAIPAETIEAVKIDGAGMLTVYSRIVIPMLVPSIMTLAILNFLAFWNELLYSMLFLQDASKQTMTVAVATLVGGMSHNMPQLMAGLLINSVPVIAIFLLFQSHIQKGIALGAVK